MVLLTAEVEECSPFVTSTDLRQKKDHPESDEIKRTSWAAILVASLVFFFSSTLTLSFSIHLLIYLTKLENDSQTESITFFGVINSVSKVAHATAIIAFSAYSFSTKQIKCPLLAGRVIALLGIMIVLFIECFPTADRKYFMLIALSIFAISDASPLLLRGYIPRMSTKTDRMKANSIFTACNMSSVVVGPAISMSFNFLEYPGIAIARGTLKLHQYSMPYFIALLVNIGLIIAIQLFFVEPPTSSKQTRDNESSLRRMWSESRSHLRQMSISVVALCFAMKAVATIAFVTVLTSFQPMILYSLDVSPDNYTLLMAGGQGFSGIVSVITAAIFIISKPKLPVRITFMIALFLFFLMFVLTYPYPWNTYLLFFGQTGCEANAALDWCHTTYMPSTYVFMGVMIFAMGTSVPLAFITFDTIYSYVLGNIDQNLMQGALMVYDDVVATFIPMLVTFLFNAYGQSLIWLFGIGVTASGMILWAASKKTIKKVLNEE